MMLPQRLLLLLLPSFLFILTRGSLSSTNKLLDLKEFCHRNQDCKSGCCRQAPNTCEAHCMEKGSEGSSCQVQAYFGQYRECPCQRNLTCVYPKNEKWLSITYGFCQKIEKKTLAHRMFF
ncbi:colipase-like protein 1 [Aotus nancymaae]|uniref:colipase-like protein 1 n=1 Tax=Aotus nancymaae TaxID=37293 RepID=UPI0030FE280F